jgi:tetratricopeptide (TPR) repeat protein
MMSDRQRQILIACAFLCSSFIIHHSSFLLADSIWVSSGAKNSLEIPKVKITDIKDGKILFVPASGRETSRELSQVVRIQTDDDASLTAAENAYANGNQWDVATDGYRRVLGSSPKLWARSWAAQRLVESAQKANRFDAAAAGYVALVQIDPLRAGNFKPTMPDERSTYIDTAVGDVNTALNDPKLSAPQRQALLSFQLELYRAKKDQKGVGETMEKLLASGASAANDPNAAGALAKLKLDQALVALDKKDYAKVMSDVKSAGPQLTDPKDQAQALLLLADAQAGVARGKDDPGAWQDAALAYMRVVAHFKENPAPPLAIPVSQALLKTAQIEEKQLKDPDAARQLYQELAKSYPQTTAAAEANAALARLQPKP